MPADRRKVLQPLPYNEEAEQAVLAAAIYSWEALDQISHAIVPEDFYVPSHQMLYMHLLKFNHRRERIDLVSLADEMDRVGDLERVGGAGMLTHFSGLVVGTSESSVARYVNIVLDYSRRRSFIEASRAVGLMGLDLSVGLDEVQALIRQKFGTLDFEILAGDPDLHIGQFLQGNEEYDWLIEYLFERKDRLIVTGKEGGGKSTVLRQIAVCASAGIHPFCHNLPIPPIRVLVIDCENGDVLSRRKFRPMIELAHKTCLEKGWPAPNPENLRVNIKSDGLDLVERVDVHWLMERVAANEPDLLIIGPLYKLHTGDPIDEGPAAKTSRAIDSIRVKYDCAVIMEAHSPYGSSDGKRPIRPYGASLWSRWPEFGFGLVEDRDVPEQYSWEPWKTRDERQWPRMLIKAGGNGGWPWVVPDDPNDFYNPPGVFRAPPPLPPGQRPNFKVVQGGGEGDYGF